MWNVRIVDLGIDLGVLFCAASIGKAATTEFARNGAEVIIIDVHSSKNTRRRWPGSASAPSGAGHGPASKCVYAPATHARSFKCRFHRTNFQGHGQGQGQGSRPSSRPSLVAANTVPRHPVSPSYSSGTVATQ
ncbi:hypothetical protein VPH35_118670 [Triticum aestivum]